MNSVKHLGSRIPQRLVVTGLVCAGLLVAPSFIDKGDPPPVRTPVVGQEVFNFVLPDATGTLVGLPEFSDKRAVVLFFMGTDCPVSNLYLPDLMDLQQRFEDRGLQVIGLHSNHGVDQAQVAKHSTEYKVTFPVLIDEGQRVADHLGASVTGQVFLLDQQNYLRYHGRIDGSFAADEGQASRRDLEEALVELLDGKEVTVAVTVPDGHAIMRTDRSEKFGDVTYSNEVSRIIQNRCQVCHRPGMIGPMSLLTYNDAAKFSDMIKEVVLDRRMPPWHADPRYGEFRNDRRLPEDELDTIVAWVDNGAPRGNPADLPEPIEYVEGWQIGTPDIILELPEEVHVPADEVMPYMYIPVHADFDEDVWISAAEVQPGNHSVVHHVIVNIIPHGSRARQGGGMTSFVPGSVAEALPPGTARRIPAHTDLLFQMHYTPIGKDQTDRTKIGLILYKGDMPPKRNRTGSSLGNMRFRIPAGDPNYEVVSRYEVKEDLRFTSAMPHMHLRGKDFRYTAVYPDGTSEILLSVPNYDFNWQTRYRFAEPPFLPKGTVLHGLAHFDNSTGNVANPDPSDTVRWGRQTWHEMMFGWANFEKVNESGGDR